MMPNIDISQYSDEQILQFINTNPELKSKYESFIVQNKKNIEAPQFKTKPLTNDEYLKLKDIKQYLDEEGGMAIEPTPHFVLKAFDENGEKVFFNVTSHSVIDLPEEKQLVDQQNENGIRVPMSVGPIKEDHDIKGDICKVIDLVVNPGIAKRLEKEAPLKEFFCQLVQSYVDQKYKLKLQDKFVSPKMKYKGKSIGFQRVKGKKPPKVEIIEEKEEQQYDKQEKNENMPANQEEDDETERIRQRTKQQFESQSQTPQNITPEWELYVCYKNREEIYDGDIDLKEIVKFRFEIPLPLLVTGKAIRIKVNKEQFQMTNGRIYTLQLKFPSFINTQTVKGQFILEKRLLTISALVQQMEQYSNQTEQEDIQLVQKDVQLENDLIFDIV